MKKQLKSPRVCLNIVKIHSTFAKEYGYASRSREMQFRKSLLEYRSQTHISMEGCEKITDKLEIQSFLFWHAAFLFPVHFIGRACLNFL